jgi:hypothetical protein
LQITIEIPDELAGEVQARGLTPESFVRSLIDGAAHFATTPLPPAKPKMDIEEFIRPMRCALCLRGAGAGRYKERKCVTERICEQSDLLLVYERTDLAGADRGSSRF